MACTGEDFRLADRAGVFCLEAGEVEIFPGRGRVEEGGYREGFVVEAGMLILLVQ